MAGKNGTQNSKQKQSPAEIFEEQLKRAIERGHEFEPTKVGKQTGQILAKCYKCSSLLTVTAIGIPMGAASIIPCRNDAPTGYGKIKQQLREQIAKRAVQERLNQLQQSEPGRIATPTGTCEHCGNGTTVVGASCRHCGMSKSLTEQTRRKRAVRSPSAKPPQTLVSGDINFQLLKAIDGDCQCPNEHPAPRRHVYIEADWDGETGKPARLTRYMCEERCIVRND